MRFTRRELFSLFAAGAAGAKVRIAPPQPHAAAVEHALIYAHFAADEIARVFRIPPRLLVAPSHRWWNDQMRDLELVDGHLWLEAMRQSSVSKPRSE